MDRIPGGLGPRRRFALVSFLGYVAFALVAFAGSVVAARLLGPSGKGEYTAWSTATTIGALVLGGSVPIGMARAYLDGERAVLLPAMVRHGVVALGIVVAGVVPALLLGLDAVPLVACILVAVPAGVLMNDALRVVQAAKRSGAFNTIRLVNAGIFTGGIALVAYAGAGNPLDLAYVFWAAGSVGAAIVSLRVMRRDRGRLGDGALRPLARLGRNAYAALVIDKLLLRLDQFVVIAVAGPASLGLYSVAVNWSEISQYVGHSMGHAVFEDERTLSDAAIRRIRRLFVVTLCLISAVIGAAGFVLIGPIFGEAFAEAKWALLLLVPGVIARGLGYTWGQILLARGQGHAVSVILGITLAAGLVAWPLGTYLFGIEGTAAASSVIYLLQMQLTHRELP
jgi:O-antigen/teichoic acid export membrane protein